MDKFEKVIHAKDNPPKFILDEIMLQEPDLTREQAVAEYNRLLSDLDKHYYDCKCYLCV